VTHHDHATTETAWLDFAATWLTLCLWGVCAADLATPGLLDRAGNIKFQDFLPFYVSARMISAGRADQLYLQPAAIAQIQGIVGQPTHVRLPYLYGPQVALFFVPFARFSFSAAAWIWASASVALFLACTYLIWRACPSLRAHLGMVGICALAFPPLFHCFLRGHISVLVLICFTVAFLALRTNRDWLAGVALGTLIFKPQFLLAIPLVLLLAGAAKLLAGLVVAACAQLAFAWIYFGSSVMRSYFSTLWHLSRWIETAELSLAPIQMHSLRAFWSLLIPWPNLALACYVLSSFAAIILAAAIWKSASPLALRFSALTLAAVLINPHLFVYDLLVLAPVLLLLMDWTLSRAQHAFSPTSLRLLLYLSFVLPLLGPISRWTHLQLSVCAFAILFWMLWRESIPSQELASHESRVV
jgi:hypothetical protein